MAENEDAVERSLISDDEVNALLDTAGEGGENGVKAYDLAGAQKITRGRLPALETIHETFARNFRVSLFSLLQREPQVKYHGIRTQKAGDYLAAIHTPASLDICRIEPLPGNALINFDPGLAFLMVDTYFGGPGRAVPGLRQIAALTPTELRFIQIVLAQAAIDLADAWTSVAQVSIQLVKHESNPLFASVAAPTDTVLVNRFTVELTLGSGYIELVMPAAMIDPLREVLTAGIVAQGAEEQDDWQPELNGHLRNAALEVRAVLTEVEISIGALHRMKPGDVIPIDPPKEVTLFAGETPLFAGSFGVSRERNAVRVLGPMQRRK